MSAATTFADRHDMCHTVVQAQRLAGQLPCPSGRGGEGEAVCHGCSERGVEEEGYPQNPLELRASEEMASIFIVSSILEQSVRDVASVCPQNKRCPGPQTFDPLSKCNLFSSLVRRSQEDSTHVLSCPFHSWKNQGTVPSTRLGSNLVHILHTTSLLVVAGSGSWALSVCWWGLCGSRHTTGGP